MTATTAKERAQLASMALLVAEEAGTLVTAGYRGRPRADEKAHRDLVTEYDRASEQLLLSRIASLAPGIPIVAEESTPGGDTSGAPLVFYVDPLDGTTNFVHGHPFWAVAVGLAEEGRPIAGAVVAPVLGVRWVGWVDPSPDEGRAGEAFRNGERCAPSATSDLGHAMIGTGFPASRDRAPENNYASFVAVKRVAQAVRRCGSAAIDLCMVADGTYDGYWERRLHAWDTFAASAIVLSAGGTITALDGGSPDYHVGNIVASNGRIHDELLVAIARGIP
jgi:myo-inositol-1(or 4)-monophosphatase